MVAVEEEAEDEDDSWEAAGDVPVTDLGQSPDGSEVEDEVAKVKQLDDAWVSEDSYDKVRPTRLHRDRLTDRQTDR